MSDIAQVLPEGYGTPLAWLFTADGEILRDFDEMPISKYLTEFEYEYNEEEDDTCTMKFKFESLRSFNLSYFQQDVVMVVQWGFLIENRKFVKSPMRKIAIRDLETSYKEDGIELEVKCTDLVSYLKNYKTRVIKNYSGGPTAQEDALANKMEGHFIDFLKEIGDGNFQSTITLDKTAAKIDKTGVMRNAEFDEKSGTYSIAKDNARAVKTIYQEFRMAKIIKGHSKSITAAIQDKLKQLDSNGRPFIMDTTDDHIHIKPRNFNQPIFKSYTYYGGTGELISFVSNTNTRKTSEDKAVTSGVNPYKKQIETVHVNAADSSKSKTGDPYLDEFKNSQEYKDIEKESQAELDRISGGSSSTPTKKGEVPGQTHHFGEVNYSDNNVNVNMQKLKPGTKFMEPTEIKPNEETLKAYINELGEVYTQNINDPLNQKPIPDLKYTVVKQTVKNPYMGDGKMKVISTIPSQVVINSAEFQSLSKSILSNARAERHKSKVLTGYTIEKIQRKYDADAEVIGDPSLIKGKIIYIANVGRLDIGKWYAISVKHKINIGKGYMCTMNLMRNPSTININTRTYASNPKYDKDSDTLKFDFNLLNTPSTVYEEIKEDTSTASDKLDNNDSENKYREEDEIAQMDNRLQIISAEEEFTLR